MTKAYTVMIPLSIPICFAPVNPSSNFQTKRKTQWQTWWTNDLFIDIFLNHNLPLDFDWLQLSAFTCRPFGMCPLEHSTLLDEFSVLKNIGLDNITIPMCATVLEL